MDTHRLDRIFKRLGFTKHSAEIYQTLRKHGPMLATHLVSAVAAHRPAAYRSLSELLEAQLISKHRQGKRSLWSALDPKRIEELFAKETAAVQKTVSAAHKTASPQHALQPTESMRILRGRDGIREAFDDVITHMHKGGTFYRFTSEKDLEAVNSYLSADYRHRRNAKKLERKVISNPVSGKKKSRSLDRFIKFIPQEADVFTQNIIQLIYRDRIAFIDLNKEEVLIIENKSLADFQTVIFNQLYKRL